MNRTVTLDLPADLLDQADQVAQQSGRTLDAILAAWIQSGAASDPTTMFTPDVEYYIYTPQAGEGAAQVLEELLAEYRAAHKSDHQDQQQQ